MDTQEFQTAVTRMFEEERFTAKVKADVYGRQCAVLEERYGMSTEAFLEAFENGLGDDEDYFHWYGLAKIRDSWRRHLEQMNRVVIEPA